VSVATHLTPALIRIAPPWRSLAETVDGLIQTLVTAGALRAEDAGDAVRAVLAREAQASTALLDIHAAVPHARLCGLAATAMGLATSASGLYEAVPTVPIQIVALVLSPADANSDHLTVLAETATLLRSATLRRALLAAHDSAEALGALHRHA
jgi:mannitol/fructose-specific phosphotransferase system IIA component (Ntr-type)